MTKDFKIKDTFKSDDRKYVFFEFDNLKQTEKEQLTNLTNDIFLQKVNITMREN